MSGFNFQSLPREEVEEALADVAIELCGCDLVELEDDESGSYWSRDQWVSCHDVGQALINAYVTGVKK